MSHTFIHKVVGHRGDLTVADVLLLLDQDSYAETFVQRSHVLDYLCKLADDDHSAEPMMVETHALVEGSATSSVRQLGQASVQCVVTSTPYWGLRMYEDSRLISWADGETCAYGHEQTPEGFIRHTVEILMLLKPALTANASVWWNLMDSYNTRTQIRGNAAEALHAMKGKDARKWGDHDARRYSAGHSYLKDGEQCMIPSRIAERASRIGYQVKSVITWAKQSNLPEPQNSRVSRALEYIIHLSPTRTPKFDKAAYRTLHPSLGGRNVRYEPDKLSDVWVLPTSSGGGHGAQFPISLPGRCIALTTEPGDLVLDPFVGSGNSGVAARMLGRRFVGMDVSPTYLKEAEKKIRTARDSSVQEMSLPLPSIDQTLPVPVARPSE
ncbi:DNA-methyltransferase [Streptomyces winkii]|uniref:DNA-methyltransferase n=1 Tax=Streptomyces winkii TaxID=3051178 RepID=UPI0028D1C915|nr:site-specific DNA-methyltransferase [Streptomyces sp. DSM 40971]